MPNLNDLRKMLQANDDLYNTRFAGHSRTTRDLATMDDMIATAQQVAGEARYAMSGSPQERQTIAKDAEKQLDLYRSERTLIAKAQQEGGPELRQSAMLGGRANRVFHRYARHFAGQNRSSRDGTLLADMQAELGKIQAHMRELSAAAPGLQAVREDLQVVQGRIDQFAAERKEVAKAQTDGGQDDQASAMAGVANNLFGQYRVHFAGLARVSRRPELLARLIEALGGVLERMKALQAQGVGGEHNTNNIGIVQDRLAVWHSEMAAIRAERQKATREQLIGELGGAANAEIAAYGQHFAGQNRKTRDLSLLTGIIDRLDEIERQMTRIDDAAADADNTANLQVVRDTLAMYCDEWDAISELQKT